ncbi:acylneuraminate cytidylyltransferase family protein [Rhodophyticola sp. CCM32]|uniref:acylneuraminate cytidylyltransferase family protein n=1 Tax=Rhodophyticola sp. CCM32 TaxID=2916397 RepID=UPI00107FBF25|nr:acylneuraminate cytidylyltransferase family protein [Rhodophyticola sp. CCM32]QBY01299.1 acylneuraminate cytidylyltransferase family protein [Rhodophyticola sp. CCM32]
MSTVATICARGGSKGVPGKNTRLLLGKPLITHTIEQALSCGQIDRVCVSTDSQEIADIARLAGAEIPFLRPAELATDTAGKLDAIIHLVEHLEATGANISRIVDLDPTSPLRALSDIDDCLRLLDDSCDTVITAFEAEKNPYFNMVEMGQDGDVHLCKRLGGPVLSRQSAPHVYSMNASIYVWHRQSLNKNLWSGRVKMHVMPRERSIDIDAPLDFRIVELILKDRQEPSRMENPPVG